MSSSILLKSDLPAVSRYLFWSRLESLVYLAIFLSVPAWALVTEESVDFGTFLILIFMVLFGVRLFVMSEKLDRSILLQARNDEICYKIDAKGVSDFETGLYYPWDKFSSIYTHEGVLSFWLKNSSKKCVGIRRAWFKKEDILEAINFVKIHAPEDISNSLKRK